MAQEIERKFLVLDDRWRSEVKASHRLRQGYLTSGYLGKDGDADGKSSGKSSVRVRISDSQAWLNIKSSTLGISRLEYEYSIPVTEAQEMLDHLAMGPVLEKTRHLIEHQGHLWELDVFYGANQGLVVAEIELTSEDETFARPLWLGREVSDDPRYFNSNLIQRPWSEWRHDS
jgi:adenylate cyclase